METVLMHTCCAPCSLSCIEPLRSEGIEPVAFWYNPNIHPWKEYEARRDCLLGYAPSIGMEVRVHEEYGLRPFVEAVAGDLDHRCGYCYTHRLEETARYAAEHGFAAFTTTLLASVYQRHDDIAEAAERLATQLAAAEEKTKALETQAQQRQRTKDESMSLMQSQLEQLQQTVLKKQLMLDALGSEKSALEYRLADALRDKARSQSLRRGR